ncbi:hypothetical protein LP421_04870 (plasmid) [Rhizobium sp. RCAM05350]|nr:hypothetical protein LP421_04870 [Rhizobium sp. RCAM05350]
MGPKVAQGTGPCQRLVIPPAFDPVFRKRRGNKEIGAEVVDVAKFAVLDHLAGELECWEEAIIEGAHVLHTGIMSDLPHFKRLGCIRRKRLFAIDVLSRASLQP